MDNYLSFTFILTDTLPFEIPIIYSNKKLYNHLNLNKEEFFKADLRESDGQQLLLKESVPFYFYIKKNELDYRKMSLMNPYAQILSTKFIQQFDNIIIDFFTHNKIYSVRAPIGINNSFKKAPDGFLEEVSWLLDSNKENNGSLNDPLIRHYFCLSKFTKITDFYKSYYAKDMESKYTYMKKVDFQNCFENIYTHSLDWAYLGGKEIAKDSINEKSRFSALLDMVTQRINYNETNGIPVGPEFSRTIAELLLTRLDNLVVDSLRKENLYFKKDYEIIRFIDDMFIFYNDPLVGDKVQDAISKEGLQLKMSINKQKSYTELRPFFRKHMWVTKLKDILFPLLSQFDIYKIQDETEIGDEEKIPNIIYEKYIYDNFFEKIRLLITEYEDQKQYLISYSISTLDNKASKIVKNLASINDTVMIRRHIIKLIDSIYRIVYYNISVDNIIKVCRVLLKLQKLGETFALDIQDIIFTKSIRLIKFNISRISELSNLIILLRFNRNLIPNYIFSEVLKTQTDYFTISTIAFYICNKPSLLYDNQLNEINDIIKKHLETIFTRFDIRKKDGNYMNHQQDTYDSYDKIMLSEHFYVIHDFYTYPLISPQNKSLIEKIKTKMCKQKVLANGKAGFELYNLFLSYIKDFDKPFMNWNSSFEDIINEIYIKKYRQINEYM